MSMGEITQVEGDDEKEIVSIVVEAYYPHTSYVGATTSINHHPHHLYKPSSPPLRQETLQLALPNRHTI